MLRRLLPIAFAALLPLTASANVLWRADYETGDKSQWTKAQEVAPDRLLVQDSKVKEGKYALKVTVVQGDNPINASGNRNELVDVNYQPEGAERYYRWFTYFDEGYPSERMWQVFTQWHQKEDHGSPPIEFDVYGEEIHLTNSLNILWKGPLQRGQWNEFIFHVKWSKDPSVGFVELWYNGQLVVPKTFVRTDSDTYMKQGLYRNAEIAGTGVVYHDGLVVGTTMEDVNPPQVADNGGSTSTGGTTGTTGGTTGGSTGTTGTGGTTGGTLTSQTPATGNGYAAPIDSEQQAGCSTTGASMVPLFGIAMAIGLLARRRKAAVKVRR